MDDGATGVHMEFAARLVVEVQGQEDGGVTTLHQAMEEIGASDVPFNRLVVT